MEFVFSIHTPPAFNKPSEKLTAFFTAWQAIPRTAGGLIRRKNGCKAAVEGCPAVMK
jgi:hypothetical protein